MNMKKIAAALLIPLIVILLAGCGSSQSQKNVVNLTLWEPSQSGLAAKQQGQIIADFSRLHPDIKITTRGIPFENYDNASVAAFNARSGPDILLVNSVDFGLFASRGYLKTIDKAIAGSPGLQSSDFYPAAWNAAVWHGQAQGIPIDTGTRVLLWNKTLFQQAGVKPFGETVQWSDMLAAAQKITDTGKGIYGWGYAGAQNWLCLYSGIGPMVHQAGGDFLSPDLSKPTLQTPQVIKAVQFYADMAKYAPRSDVSNTQADTYDISFANNKTAMIVAGFWEIPLIKQTNPNVQFGESLPKDITVDSSTGGWILSVPSYVSDAKMTAIRTFYQYIFQPKNTIAFTSLMPALKAATPLATALQDPVYDLYWKILNLNAQHPIALNPGLPQESIAMMQSLQKVVLGQKTPEQAMADTQQQFSGILQQTGQ
jgi:multiple sugar transport system substrate-binding protein